jgi:thiamine biosynthesis lipoprotein
MGCDIEIQLEAKQSLQILEGLPASVEAIEQKLSRFRPTSDLMQLNHRAGNWQTVNTILFAAVSESRRMALLTDGLVTPLVRDAVLAAGYTDSFDQLHNAQRRLAEPLAEWQSLRLRRDSMEVFVPRGSSLDLGGTAKGWTAAYLADQLENFGPCCVNLGGDVAVRGHPSGLDGWPVKIEHPDYTADITLANSSVATSGTDFRRWQTQDGEWQHHIIDPRTAAPAKTDVSAVTVVHRNLVTAEACAKAVLILGSHDGLKWLHGLWDAAAIVTLQDGTVLCSKNWLYSTQETLS